MDALEDLLTRVDAGELGDPLPVLAYIAGQAVEIDDEDLNGGRRRALLLVAAGGDPHRDLDVDDRAVKALLRVRERPIAREAALFLAADVDLAWRLFSLSLLAEELAG
jgi:hypothetical protein